MTCLTARLQCMRSVQRVHWTQCCQYKSTEQAGCTDTLRSFEAPSLDSCVPGCHGAAKKQQVGGMRPACAL